MPTERYVNVKRLPVKQEECRLLGLHYHTEKGCAAVHPVTLVY